MFEVGDEVIRRTEVRGKSSPLMGRVVGLRGEKVRVRWAGALKPFRGGRADNHSTIKPDVLLAATEENIADSQRRIYRRLSRSHLEDAENYEKWARIGETEGVAERAAHYREMAEKHRRKAEEIQRRLDA